jgi:hypothetical protein
VRDWKYYVFRAYQTGAPLAVFRFKGERLFVADSTYPESLDKRGCWKNDGRLGELFANGDLCEIDDEASEKEAQEAARSLGIRWPNLES